MAGGGPEKTHYKVVKSVTIMRLVLRVCFLFRAGQLQIQAFLCTQR